MSPLGLKQAAETGSFLDTLLSNEGIRAEDIHWMSSPFLRCLQTSHAALDAFQTVSGDVHGIPINIEQSIFEWDGHNGLFHKSLPPNVEERQHYFPRLDLNYQSMFIPTLPEPREHFHARCQQVAAAIPQRYPYRPRTAIVAVTHAAGCIGLAAALTNRTLADITPAAPCSIYQLTRTSNNNNNNNNNNNSATTTVWTMDAHDMKGSRNGYTDHLSDLGRTTIPWNNFCADKQYFHGYTGPATSRFAPDGYYYIAKADDDDNNDEL